VALRPLALILPPSGAAALVNEALNPGTLSFSETVLAAGALLGLSLGLFAFAVYWARRSVREG
jgi:hypothetical protein